MTKNTKNNENNISERLTELEHKYTRQKKINLVLAAFLIAGVVIAAAEVNPVIEAKKIILRDDAGNVRIQLSANDETAEFTLHDSKGTKRVAVGSYANSSGLAVFDSDKKTRIGLGLSQDGPALGMYNSNGTVIASVIPGHRTVDLDKDSLLTFDLGQFTTVLSEKRGKNNKLQARILLIINSDRNDAIKVKKELIARKAEIRNTINFTMIGMDSNLFIGNSSQRQAGYRALRISIKDAVNGLITGSVDDVLLEDFIFQ